VTDGVARLADRLFLALAGIAGLMAAAMMAVTTIDVAGRFALNAPLHGAFEATEVMMGLIVFLALPLTTRRREHITVTMFDHLLPERVKRGAALIFGVVCAVLCGLLAWRLGLHGERLLRVGEVTLELGIPRGGIATAMCWLLWVAAIAFVLDGIAGLRGRDAAEIGG
jgi:TRAP-type C4-dicarboxylate transport system permease small subunit